MPTDHHQALLVSLSAFFHFFQRRGGTVRFAPLRLRVREGKYRELDLCCCFPPPIHAGTTAIGRARHCTSKS